MSEAAANSQATPPTMSQADFARHIGKGKPYVTGLKKAGRLVLDEAGLVVVEASLERIAATATAPERAAIVTPRFSEARDMKERYDAANAQLDYEERCGLLTPSADVASAAQNAGVRLRSRIESMADTLAPQLAPVTDESRVRAILVDWAQGYLAESSAAMAEVAATARARRAALPPPA